MRKLGVIGKALVQALTVPRLFLKALRAFVLAAIADGTVLMHVRTMVLDPRCKFLWSWSENRAWCAPSQVLARPILPVIWIFQMHAFCTSMRTLCEAAVFPETCVPGILAASNKQAALVFRGTEL